MGCSQSKIENEEVVSQCKDRKLYMKEVVFACNAFAATHSSYAQYLRNIGATLNDYTHSEVSHHHHHSHSAPSLSATSPPHPPPSLMARFQSNFQGLGFLDFFAKNPDQQAKWVVGFGVFIFLTQILGVCWGWIWLDLC